jgi:hypothetical protein
MPKPEFLIDTQGCPETYHELRRAGAGEPLECYHADDQPCPLAEFKFWPESIS